MPATAQVDSEQRWVDVQTAAAILDMPERTIRYHCANGRLPARKFGRAWRIRRWAVMPDEEGAA